MRPSNSARLPLLAFTFALALTALGVPHPAVGQADGAPTNREVLLGTAIAGQPKAIRESQTAPTAGDREIALQLDLARDRLAAGETEKANEILRSVIARQPNSPAADEASALLGRQVERPGAATASTKSAVPSEAPMHPRPPQPTPRSEATQGVSPLPGRPAERLDEQFRSVVGDRVYFENGSFELDQRAGDVLAQQALWLKSHPRAVVSIEGHADDSLEGSLEAALAISRAEAVRQRLMHEGVAPEQIRTLGHGRDRRVALCDQEVCKQQNRRAVTIVGPLNREARLRGMRE